MDPRYGTIDDLGVEVRARVAGALGITALALAMVAPCTCWSPMLVAGVLGVGSAWVGMRARSDLPSRAGAVWASTGIIGGVTALALTLLVALVIGGFLVLWVMGFVSSMQAADLW